MPFNELLIAPMRKDLNRYGVKDLRTPEDVDDFIRNTPGTIAIAVNSTCGCSSSRMRPAFGRALQNDRKPDATATVFAGQDMEATARAREYFTGYAPSSPSIALLKDGELIFMMERRDIEGRHPDAIAADLIKAFDRFCGVEAATE